MVHVLLSQYRIEDIVIPRNPSAEILKELSDSRYTVYDVLPAFFEHAETMVVLG
jgi:acetyl-CoA carboxylase / biotin carboxylase 1